MKKNLSEHNNEENNFESDILPLPTASSVLEMMVQDISLSDIDPSTSKQDESSTSNHFPIKTPNIDAAIAGKSKLPVTGRNSQTEGNKQQTQHEVRINQLEKQICLLISNKDSTNDFSSELSDILSTSDIKPKQTRGKNVKNKSNIFKQHFKSNELDRGTYLSMVKELEKERESRWKAEQAAKKLVHLIKNLSNENSQRKSVQQSTSLTTDRLKEALLKERQINEELKKNAQFSDTKMAQISQKLLGTEESKTDLETKVQEINRKFEKVKSESAKQEIANNQKNKNYEIKIATLKKEIGLLNMQNKSLQEQVKRVQELLIEREQEHKATIQQHVTLDSPEFYNALSREITKKTELHKQEVNGLEVSISALQIKYNKLEDEFREALYIEEERYLKVDRLYRESQTLLESITNNHKGCKERDDKSKNIINELTTVAKEQKVKLNEICKCRQEMESQYKERIFKLESENEKFHRMTIQLEIIKEEKSKLLAEVSGLRSIVEGLRDERKIWGQELAQQSVSLTKDRGRLESKIESLQLEISSLKKQNLRDLDALKIKTKIADDQTETIRKIKEAIKVKDLKIKEIQDDMLNRHRKLEQDVEDLTQENTELQKQNQYQQKRKVELKNENSLLTEEIEALQENHNKLVEKWAEKGVVLSQVESHVKKMKDNFDTKENKIKMELRKAVQEKIDITNRMSRVDEEFQKQLNMAKTSHENNIQMLNKMKSQEVAGLNSKILSLEEEMREILRGAERQKKLMEDKLNQATSAFQDLRQELDLHY